VQAVSLIAFLCFICDLPHVFHYLSTHFILIFFHFLFSYLFLLPKSISFPNFLILFSFFFPSSPNFILIHPFFISISILLTHSAFRDIFSIFIIIIKYPHLYPTMFH